MWKSDSGISKHCFTEKNVEEFALHSCITESWVQLYLAFCGKINIHFFLLLPEIFSQIISIAFGYSQKPNKDSTKDDQFCVMLIETC